MALYRYLALIELLDCPAYGYAAYWAARQARALGHKRISLIEFGVATGAGLLVLERHAARISRSLGVDFEIYGFDTGAGLPNLEGFRDTMHRWHPGEFGMNQTRLTAQLRRAKLVLGDVNETVDSFFGTYAPAPVGAVLFDLDLYSSTKAALRIFDTSPQYASYNGTCWATMALMETLPHK